VYSVFEYTHVIASVSEEDNEQYDRAKSYRAEYPVNEFDRRKTKWHDDKAGIDFTR